MRHLAVALAVLLMGCGAQDPAPYLATLDGLSLPPSWEVASTEVESQDGSNGCIEAVNLHCPSVTRYLLVSGELTDVLDQVKAALGEGSFRDIEVHSPACDSTLSGPRCSMTGTKEGMVIQVNIYPPGEDVDQLGLSRLDLAMVRLILSRN